MSPGGLVFDFDGTIVDTETPVYESWRATFVDAGAAPVPLDVWVQHIGLADGAALDMRAVLCEQLGVSEVPEELERFRRSYRDEILGAQQIRDGVLEWVEHAVSASIPLAIASSSASSWVVPHLERLGLAQFFPVVSCADPPTPGKPDPAVYRRACTDLGVDPKASIAIEDSSHGVSAAIGAGMRCLAVPGPITKGADFSHATATAESLAHMVAADWLG